MFNYIIQKLGNFHEKYSSLCGQIYAIIVSFGLTGMFCSAKLLKQRHPVPYILYYNGICITLTISLLCFKLKVPLYISKMPDIQKKLYHRGLFGAGGWIFLTLCAS